MPSTLASTSHEEVLDNGLRVILIEHRANPMIASSVVVGAGAVHEPEGMNGASHFLEHLLFNGTDTRTQRELYDEADRYGAYNNATTKEDHTLFFLLIQKEFADKGLALQADMLFHSTLPPDKFEKEKGIVLEELAKDKNDPGYLAGKSFRAFAYAGTPLARSVLGTEGSIGALKREDVLAYYKTRYVPDNMALVIVGDFDTSSMMAIVRKTFGAEPKAGRPTPVAGAWPAPPEKNLLSRPLEAGRTYLHAAFPLPVAPSSPELGAADLLLSALASGGDSPLSQVLRTGSDPMVLSYSLGIVPRTEPWATVEFEATLSEDQDAGAVLSELAAGLRSLRPDQPVWDRIGRVRFRMRTEEVLGADQIHYYMIVRSPYVLGSPPGYLAGRVDALDALDDRTLERVASILRDGLGTIRISLAGPGRPEESRTWAPPEETPVPPAAVKARLLSETLPSGAQVILQRNDDSRVFAIHLMLRPRSASEPEGKEGIADFLHRLLLRGTLFHDAASLSSRLDEIGATLKVHDSAFVPYDDYYTTPEFSFLRLEMPSDRWREGVALLGEVVRYPKLAEADIEAVRSEMLDLQKKRSDSVRSIAGDLLNRTLAPGHPLASSVLGTAESIASITADDLRSFHEMYATGNRMILTQVGPVSPSEVLDAVKSAFGDLPEGTGLPPAALAPVTRKGLKASETVGKEQAYIAMGAVFDAEPADLPALSVAGALLSDVLSFRLREEQGLAYSMSAAFTPYGGRTALRVMMGTRQANVDEAIEGLSTGLEAFKKDEHDAGAVERAANARRGRLLMRRLTRVNQAYFAGLDQMRGRPPGDNLKFLSALLTVSAEDVRRVVKKYLEPEKLAVVVVR
jgi:predicted Zn-dependent peptidase